METENRKTNSARETVLSLEQITEMNDTDTTENIAEK